MAEKSPRDGADEDRFASHLADGRAGIGHRWVVHDMVYPNRLLLADRRGAECPCQGDEAKRHADVVLDQSHTPTRGCLYVRGHIYHLEADMA